MKNLTKENFFNELQSQFPEQMRQFCAWIDAYKHSVQWSHLFARDVKFHHIPLEMQSGIIYRFFAEVFDMHNIPMFDVTNEIEVVQTIKDVFAEKFMQDQLATLQDDGQP